MNAASLTISDTPEGRVVRIIRSASETSFRRSPAGDLAISYGSKGPWMNVEFPQHVPAEVMAALEQVAS